MQILKKLLFIALIAFSVTQCKTSKTAAFWQKQNTAAYYNVWHTGAAPAGTGANFFLEFKSQDSTLQVDSFIVNNISLNADIVGRESQMLIIGRNFTPPNFDDVKNEIPEFYRQENYSGRVKLTVKGESFWIDIESFEKRQATHLPL